MEKAATKVILYDPPIKKYHNLKHGPLKVV